MVWKRDAGLTAGFVGHVTGDSLVRLGQDGMQGLLRYVPDRTFLDPCSAMMGTKVMGVVSFSVSTVSPRLEEGSTIRFQYHLLL